MLSGWPEGQRRSPGRALRPLGQRGLCPGVALPQSRSEGRCARPGSRGRRTDGRSHRTRWWYCQGVRDGCPLTSFYVRSGRCCCRGVRKLDVVATSIGGGGATSVFGLSEEDWDRAFDLNLKSAWRLMVASEPHMTAGGSIVTVSSGAAEGRGPAMPYSVAKAGVEKLTTGAAATLAPRGIRVNCIRVGMIWGAFAARGMDEELREVRRKNVALQTEGNPWDIASAALFLSTDQARWISGQVLSVDGGDSRCAAPAQPGPTR